MKKIFTLFCLVFLPAALLMADPLPFPEDTIAYNDRFNNRQWVQFDEDGNLHITYTGQFGTAANTRDIYYVTDESGEFVETQVTDNGVNTNYSSFVFDEDGTMHMVYTQHDNNNNFQLVYQQKENGDFSDPVWITSGDNKATPHIAIGSDNVVHFVYYNFVPGQISNYTYHITYELDTETIGTPTQLGNYSVDPSSENDIRVVVDSNNHAHVIYRDGSMFGGTLRYFNNTSGSMVEETTPVTESIVYPAMTIDHEDKLHIIVGRVSDNRIVYLTRDDEGFSTPVNATPPDIGNPLYYRSVDVDDEGRFYFTYHNTASNYPTGFFLVSGIEGSFEEPSLIWNDPEDNYLFGNTSSVAARGDGYVATFYAPSTSRDDEMVCDIFMKRGLLFTDLEPIIEVSPASLNFGTVEVNESHEMNLTIYNQGPVELNIQEFQFSDDVFFSTIEGPTTIPPFGNLLLPVVFTPEEPVDYQETMTILSDAANDPEVEISLSGTGVIYEAIIDVAPSIEFEETQINETSYATLDIENSGNIDLEITGIDITGDDQDFFGFDADLPLIVEAQEEMQLNLSFSPEEDRDYFATLIISSDAANDPEVEVSLSGTGAIYEAIIDVAASLQFEETDTGDTSYAVLEILNSGNIDLEINVLEITGEDPGFFGYETDLPIIVEADQEKQLDLWFSPEEGREYFATLIITSNASNEAEAEVSLSGEGLNDTFVETQETLEKQVSLFPNPATEQITLQFAAGAPAGVNIRLTNTSGETVLNREVENIPAGENEINLDLGSSSLKPGVYFLEIVTEDQRTVKKVIIQ